MIFNSDDYGCACAVFRAIVGFTLQHLRFLVLDEADRLLGNAYHAWVRQLLMSTSSAGLHTGTIRSHGTVSSEVPAPAAAVMRLGTMTYGDGPDGPVTVRCELSHSHDSACVMRHFMAPPPPPLQRLLFSATLTDNPRKLAMLG